VTPWDGAGCDCKLVGSAVQAARNPVQLPEILRQPALAGNFVPGPRVCLAMRSTPEMQRAGSLPDAAAGTTGLVAG